MLRRQPDHSHLGLPKTGSEDRRPVDRQLKKSEGTSRDAEAWYDTNPTDMQEVYIVCNGHWQVQTFKLTRHMDKVN